MEARGETSAIKPERGLATAASLAFGTRRPDRSLLRSVSSGRRNSGGWRGGSCTLLPPHQTRWRIMKIIREEAKKLAAYTASKMSGMGPMANERCQSWRVK
ncbi:hypothetical protein CEXT_138411 [Caerostris extrusa]|uniref:Uncharacterized protein n=1 Tax=Caerostris extrusa TaxID=172846 RepID=A0AAV4VNP2_CAEEX|nr:hypothetical protein CEXT_138411 [Caerostris extrusa]